MPTFIPGGNLPPCPEVSTVSPSIGEASDDKNLISNNSPLLGFCSPRKISISVLLPAPEPPTPLPMMDAAEAAEVADETDAPQEEEGESEEDGEITVGSWEDLPGGDYLDPDEEGTVWFRANNGDNWYQNADGSWTKWQD